MLTACHALASEIWSAVATPIQQAAIAAFQDDPSIATYLQQAASTHALIASRLHQTLIQLDVDCPRPAGGFYLYPDFSSWRHKLATMGITTSELLAQYLLDQWDISSLPASAFEETGETLRLRLATSQLCEPEASLTPWEREAALWSLLQDPANAPLPALTRAQERWQEVIHFLNNQ
jgi:aspartate/methionine/tyrosine aminotransferase